VLPRGLQAISANVDARAATVLDAALGRRTGDGVADIAMALPMAVVPDLVGWPRDQRSHLLSWGGATFDILGPLNKHAIKALPGTTRMLQFARRVIKQRTVIEGSLGHDVLVAADNGQLAHSECSPLMIDYIAPSLDTTISAISNALFLFATHPEQWQMIRENPELRRLPIVALTGKALKGRGGTRDIPAILPSAKGRNVDQKTGFEVGADDYITKPFSPRKLVERINAILGHANSNDVEERQAS